MNITEKYVEMIVGLLDMGRSAETIEEKQKVIDALMAAGRSEVWAAVDRALEWNASGRRNLLRAGQSTDRQSEIG